MNEFYLYRHAWISAPHFNERLIDEQCNALLKQGGWLVRNSCVLMKGLSFFMQTIC